MFKNWTGTVSWQKATLAFLLFGLIVYGAYLRLLNLGHQPYWMDEGYTINAVLSISETGQSILDSGLPYTCPIYCYPTAWLADTLGHDAFSYRLLAAGFGILLIPLIYIIGHYFFNAKVGIITAFLISFEYFQIAWSRQARWYTLFACLFWLALYAFYRAYYEPKNRYLWGGVAVAATTLAILTHGLGYLIPFIIVLWVFIDRVVIERDFTLKTILIIFIALGATAFALESVFGTSRISRLFSDFTLYNVAPYYLAYYLGTYLAFLPPILIALWRLPRSYIRPVAFLLCSLSAYALPLFFLTNIIHYRYAWHLTPVIFLLAAYGLWRLWQYKPSFIARLSTLALGCMIVLAGHLTFTPHSHYWLENDNPSHVRRFPGTAGYFAYTPQPDWNDAYAFLARARTADDLIVSSHPHFNKIFLHEPGYWLAYNYHGLSDLPSSIKDGREYYVGARVVGSLAELRALVDNNSGYIIFDYMAADNRIPDETLRFIRRELELVYHNRLNTYSQIWIYRF